MPGPGVPGPRGGTWSGGPGPGGVWSGGVCSSGGAWWRPPGTATDVGSTHPTGMHSCYQYLWNFCKKNINYLQNWTTFCYFFLVFLNSDLLQWEMSP